MSKAATSVLVYSIVFGLSGLGMLLIPNLLLPLFGFPQTPEAWIRMAGLLAVSLAAYDFLIGRNGIDILISASVPIRIAAGVVMIATYLLGLIGPGILVFAALDIGCAIWTAMALRVGVVASA